MTDTAQTEKSERTDYTEGSVLRSILHMGLPSMVGFLLQHVYALTDMWWVSKLSGGESGVAAITFVSMILGTLYSFNSLVGPGSVAVISRRYGERAFDRAEKAIKETIILKLFFGALLGITGYFFAGTFLRQLGATGEALELGTAYGTIVFPALPVLFATYSIFTAMRGVANPNMALVLMACSSALNIILDPILMFGYLGLPALGIRGAAIATSASYTLTFLAGLALFYLGRTNVALTFRGKERVSIDSMLTMIRIGIPAWLGELSFFGARAVVTRLVAPFGTAVVAAWGIGNQISAFGIALLVGIGLGLSSLIGHNLGSEKYERARKTGNQAVLLGAGIMTLFGLITFGFAQQLNGMFFSDPETIRQGVMILRILSICFPFIGVLLMTEQIHMGVGMNVPAMVITMGRSWGLQVLPILILTRFLGFDQQAVWWSISLSGIVAGMVFYLYYRKGRWLLQKV
jgi:putative MATE family efflux protein